MSFVAAAIGGSALIGAGASLYAANKQSDAANQAAQLQQQQMAENRANLAQTRADLSPFVTGGQGATNLLQSMYGIGNGGNAVGQNALEGFYKSPDFQFALRGGSEALNNSLASRSGALGGNAVRAQTEFSSGLATQNLGNYLQRLMGMSGQGIQAAGGIASAAGQTGNTNMYGANVAGQAMMGAGTAEASGALGLAKQFNGLANNTNFLAQMNKSSYGANNGLTNGVSNGGYNYLDAQAGNGGGFSGNLGGLY